LREHHLDSNISIRKQCEILNVSRSSFYYEAKPAKDQHIIDVIYKIWSEDQSKGYRMITHDLRVYYKLHVNHKMVSRIMRKIGIKGIIPKRNLSRNNKLLYKYPYIINNLCISRSNMVWATDISYVKLPTGYMYLIVIIDIYSRCILEYEISNNLGVDFCVRCLERCINKYGIPVILNTDQGVQFTSHEWVNMLNEYDIQISMDGKGRWADNIIVERFWRTIKYCSIFMNGVETIFELKHEVNKFINYYNNKRLHSALKYQAPMTVYKQLLSSNDRQDFILYCDIETYRKKMEKQRLKYTA